MALPMPSASAGPALFHVAIARHKRTWARISGPVPNFAPSNILPTFVHNDSPVACSPTRSPADHSDFATDDITASVFTASASDNRDSLFSVADDQSSCTTSDHSSYTTARSTTSLSVDFHTQQNPERHGSDLGSDNPAAVTASLAENRRILDEGFDMMAVNQAGLETLAQTILVEQLRVRSGVVGFADTRATPERRKSATEHEAMQILVESVPFSAEGRGHCDASEVRRVAMRGERWSLMSGSPYPRLCN